MEYYLYQLTRTTTTGRGATTCRRRRPCNQKWDGTGDRSAHWRTLARQSSQYTIELLPAKGEKCVAGQTATTMLNQASGTFRIRATGRAGKARAGRRRRAPARRFLDFIYFTDYETSSPAAYASSDDRDYAKLGRADRATAREPGRPNLREDPVHQREHESTGRSIPTTTSWPAARHTLGRNSAGLGRVAGQRQARDGLRLLRGHPTSRGRTCPADPLDVPPTNAGLAAAGRHHVHRQDDDQAHTAA